MLRVIGHSTLENARRNDTAVIAGYHIPGQTFPQAAWNPDEWGWPYAAEGWREVAEGSVSLSGELVQLPAHAEVQGESRGNLNIILNKAAQK